MYFRHCLGLFGILWVSVVAFTALGNCTKMSLPLGLNKVSKTYSVGVHRLFNKFCIYKSQPNILLAPVVQKLDSAIHRINRYLMDKYYEN